MSRTSLPHSRMGDVVRQEPIHLSTGMIVVDMQSVQVIEDQSVDDIVRERLIQ